jgi:glucokinase
VATATKIDLPTGSRTELVEQAKKLPLSKIHTVAFPFGGSTLRASLLDLGGKVLQTVELEHPEEHYVDVVHAIAAVLIKFGCRVRVGAAFIAGPVPKRGFLQFTNIQSWGKFDRNVTKGLFGLDLEWFNDGPAGYFGIPALDDSKFVVLHQGSYEPGDSYGYAIWGHGLNLSYGHGREDGHTPFAASNDAEWEFYNDLKQMLGHRPDWEEAVAGGHGFKNAGIFYLSQPSSKRSHHYDPLMDAFEHAPRKDRGKVVTRYALSGNPIALEACRLVFGILGNWLGSMAVSSQLKRIDISPGIFGNAELRELALRETNFLAAYLNQGRDQFSDDAKACTLRVCLENPEQNGAVLRAVDRLRALI